MKKKKRYDKKHTSDQKRPDIPVSTSQNQPHQATSDRNDNFQVTQINTKPMVKKFGNMPRRTTIERLGLMVAVGLLLATWYQAYLTRETLHNSERAFIFFKNIKIMSGSSKPSIYSGKQPFGLVNFENTGVTPARNVMLFTSTCARDRDLPKNFSYPLLSTEEYHPNLVAPRAEIQTGGIFSEQILNDLQSGKITFFVYGEISYVDIFNIRHMTQFCQQSHGILFQEDGTIKEYLFGPCKEHNCYDDDCPKAWGQPGVDCKSAL